jgi:hypothetical protein
MWFEPGPFAIREPFPDDPPISASAKFAAALDVALPHLDAGDELLAAAHRTIADVTEDGLAAGYGETIGAAQDLDAAHAFVGDDLTADTLTAAGQPADSLHDGSLRYLPPPATPITTDFVEPPPAPTQRARPDRSADDDNTAPALS